MSNADEVIAQAVESAEAKGYPTKKMYHVEKFLPPTCPKCKHPFVKEVRHKEKFDAEGRVTVGEEESGDYTLLLGDIVDGKKVIRETTGYNIIICAHCRNYTARILLETACLSDKALAEKLIAEKGFVNLMEVVSFGNMARDLHCKYADSPKLEVRDAMK